MVFGYLQPKIGMCWTRIICGSCTTFGLLLMSFYKFSSQLIFWGTMLGKSIDPSIAPLLIADFMDISLLLAAEDMTEGDKLILNILKTKEFVLIRIILSERFSPRYIVKQILVYRREKIYTYEKRI